jgi:1-acyl-sn-glycerol-3-phosphate acyltransferase
MPSFLSKAEVANYPIFGGITTALKSVYVDRDSRNGKDEVIKFTFIFLRLWRRFLEGIAV